MTRTGKIARLPQYIREELNERLHNGEPAIKLVEWLHEQDSVWEVLFELDYDPITEQNLSEWKNGGYQDWVANREAKALVVQMLGRKEDLEEATDEANLGDCLATLLMVELMKLAKVLVQDELDPKAKWKQLCEVSLQLTRLRRDRSRDIRTDIQERRWEWEEEDRETAQQEKQSEWVKKQKLATYRLLPLTRLMAGNYAKGEAGRRMAAHVLEVENDLPDGFLSKWEGGAWGWDEEDGRNEWKWYPDKKAEVGKSGKRKAKSGNGGEGQKEKGRRKKGGKKTKHPTTNIEQPTSNEEEGTDQGFHLRQESRLTKTEVNPSESDQIQPVSINVESDPPSSDFGAASQIQPVSAELRCDTPHQIGRAGMQGQKIENPPSPRGYGVTGEDEEDGGEIKPNPTSASAKAMADKSADMESDLSGPRIEDEGGQAMAK